MPDVGVQRGPEGRVHRVCVIGAGVSGLVAAKVMRGRGCDVTVIEKNRDLGGVWDPIRCYSGVQTQTPRDLYCFSDFPMPAEYPEWPSGAQVHAYLHAYTRQFGLHPAIRFGTEIVSASPRADGPGWSVTLRDIGSGATETQHTDSLVIATGQFSRPRTLTLPGEDAFRAAGGCIRHSSEPGDAGRASGPGDAGQASKPGDAGQASEPGDAGRASGPGDAGRVEGRDVVVVGFSKSATDVAMNALADGARTVCMVYRQATWKIPYFFGGVVNFKHILYCRASEAMFMPWAPSRGGRLARRLLAPAIWMNWRALESLLEMQFGLKKVGLRPTTRIEDGIHCATSIETPGFYRAVREGRLRMVRGNVTGYEPGVVVVDGATRIAADAVVLAIGWRQDLPFLGEDVLSKLVEPDGQYRLHRSIVNPDLPGLGFVGFNSSFTSTLSAELGAHWLARYLDGSLRRQPTEASMRAAIARTLDWKRRDRTVAQTYRGLCVAPFHHAHFDELMADMGARRKPKNVLAAHLAPVSPKAYARLLETASG